MGQHDSVSAPGAGRPALRPAAMRLLLLCLGFSGATGLVYEVLWMRLFADRFGSTTLATSLVLTAYMGGMALGAASLRYWQRLPWPRLRIYALLEILIGIYALASPLAFRLLDAVMPLLDGAGPELAALLRFVAAGLLLLLPTACMGATLPVLMRVFGQTAAETGRIGGLLYGMNTIGAVLGTLLAGFWLIPVLGITTSLLTIAGVNLLIGLAAWLLAGPARAYRPELAAASESRSAGRLGIPLLAIAASGLAAMVYEVIWTRLLSMIFGTSTYAFSILLASFLMGLALGSLTLRGLSARSPERVTRLLALMLALAGLLGLVTLSLMNRQALWYSALYLQIEPWFRPWLTAYDLSLACKALLAMLLMLPAAFCFGAIFPLVLQLTRAQGLAPDQALARSYVWNTLGSVAGSLLAGLVLGPWLGFYPSLQLAALGLVGLAWPVLATLDRPDRRQTALLLAAGVLGLTLALTMGPYDPRPLFLEVYQEPDLLRHSTAEQVQAQQLERLQVPFYRDGVSASVAVIKFGDGYTLITDGKADASNKGELGIRSALAHLPLLLAPERRRVMVIGLGGGATAAAVLAHPVERLDVVEIEQAVVEAYQRFFRPFTRPVDQDPRTRLRIDDARTVVRRLRDYDVLIAQASHPWRPGSARLFTQEFWRDCREALQPQGVFAQWVQLYRLSPAQFRSIVATFQSVFPQVMLFRFGQDGVLIGSREPLLLDARRIRARAAWPEVRADLAQLQDPELHQAGAADLLVHLEAGAAELADLGSDTRINSEDRPYIEFAAPLTQLSDERSAILTLLNQAPPPLLGYLTSEDLSPAERAGLSRDLAQAAQKYGLGPRLGPQLEALERQLR